MKFTYTVNAQEITVTLKKTNQGYTISIGEDSYQVEQVRAQDGQLQFSLDGKKVNTYWAAAHGNARWIAANGKTYLVEKPLATKRRRGGAGAGGGGHIAPMSGQVREVLVAEGDAVEQGQTLLLLEAMKMEIRIQAAVSGTVKALHISAGQQVNKDAVLVEVEE